MNETTPPIGGACKSVSIQFRNGKWSSVHSISYADLKRFLDDNRNEYMVEEREGSIDITFLPAASAARQKLGESTYMKVHGVKKGDVVILDRLVVIEDDISSEVSLDSLDGWLDFVKDVRHTS